MICKWNTFTVHWHFVDLYIVHTAGRVWTIQVTVYTMEIEPRGYSIFNLLVYLFFTYIHKGTTKLLLTEFLSNCIDVSSELWSYSEKLVYVAYLLFFFVFFYRMAMFQSQEVASEVLPFGAFIFSLSIYKIYKGYPLGLIFKIFFIIIIDSNIIRKYFLVLFCNYIH